MEEILLPDKVKKEIMELSKAINEVVASYKKLKHPILESQARVPKAAEQLDKISEQTEAATQTMLDTVEKITQREEEVIRGLTEIKAKAEHQDEIVVLSEQLIQKATTTCNDAYNIMNALQFQDITSQQLNHAVSLLDEIETKLQSIMSILQGEGTGKIPIMADARQKRAFDPHAHMTDKKTQQADIDSIFAKKK